MRRIIGESSLMSSRQATSEYAARAGRAVRRVGQEVKAGRLIKAPCVDCGEPQVQAHHPNGYQPPHDLDVVWLCYTHHMARHGRRVKPSWEHGVRAYMDRTRPDRYLTQRHIGIITGLTNPTGLLHALERLWGMFRTDEEREWALRLIDRLSGRSTQSILEPTRGETP